MVGIGAAARLIEGVKNGISVRVLGPISPKIDVGASSRVYRPETATLVSAFVMTEEI